MPRYEVGIATLGGPDEGKPIETKVHTWPGCCKAKLLDSAPRLVLPRYTWPELYGDPPLDRAKRIKEHDLLCKECNPQGLECPPSAYIEDRSDYEPIQFDVGSDEVSGRVFCLVRSIYPASNWKAKLYMVVAQFSVKGLVWFR